MESIHAAVLQHIEALAAEHFPSEPLSQIPIFVAYSGGLDSSVLLHICQQLKLKQHIGQLRAAHINHGLQAENDYWQQHCEQACAHYQIPISCKKYQLLAEAKVSENQARQARYHFFESLLEKPGLLLLAHHNDDQLETQLFRMVRGTGVHGLTGMPRSRKLANGWILRPLLERSRQELSDYANQHALEWIEDPSNQQNDYSRNFLRNQVLPLLHSKWPQLKRSFNQLSELAIQQSEILDQVAEQDRLDLVQSDQSLCLYQFNQLSLARRQNLIHYWVRWLTRLSPAASEIKQAVLQLSQSDSHAIKLKLAKGWLRCYQKRLYYTDYEEPDKLSKTQQWQNLSVPLKLENGVRLKCKDLSKAEGLQANNPATDKVQPMSLRRPSVDEIVTVRPRTGGEVVKPYCRAHRAELKKIYQELKVPTWKRKWLPLIYYNDKLAAVPGVFVADEFFTQTEAVEINLQLSIGNDL